MLPLVLLAGCVPTWKISGVAFTPGAGAPHTIAQGIPRAGAEMRFACAASRGQAPEGWVMDVLLRADAEGGLRGQGNGWLPMECTITVTAPGFRPYRVPVRDVCTRRFDQLLCEAIDFEASLRPLP